METVLQSAIQTSHRHIFKSANGIVFVEKNGSRINIKHEHHLIFRNGQNPVTDVTTYILHIVHHAGSENEILKYILIAQLDLQCLYVQLHIWRELSICHTELLKRCKYCTIMVSGCAGGELINGPNR